jgi:hypothetical protein
MSRGLRSTRALGLAAAAASFVLGIGASFAGAANCGDRSVFGTGAQLRFFGLTSDQRLVRFGECAPSFPRDIGPITGLAGGDGAIVGIDFRVQDGKLYGVGDGGGVYTIDTATAQATLASQLTVALEGTSFGVDFNPAADRLRIVSDTGQNLRHNVNAGGTTLEDGDLNYTAGVTALGITGAAYTNNDLDPNTGTTLLDVDPTLDQVAIQSPPNAGSLAATGKLGIDAQAPVGFDVYSVVRRGKVVRNLGFAVIGVPQGTGFYRIELTTGAAIFIAPVGASVVDVAAPIDQ